MDNGSTAVLTVKLLVSTDSGDLPDPIEMAKLLMDVVGDDCLMDSDHDTTGVRLLDIEAQDDWDAEEMDMTPPQWLIKSLIHTNYNTGEPQYYGYQQGKGHSSWVPYAVAKVFTLPEKIKFTLPRNSEWVQA